MTAPVEPDIIEEIRESFATDLSWVTFMEKDPTEPCNFVECDKDADWSLTALPCGHEYFFCTVHTTYTRHNMSMYEALGCTVCKVLITDIKYEPLKRG